MESDFNNGLIMNWVEGASTQTTGDTGYKEFQLPLSYTNKIFIAITCSTQRNKTIYTWYMPNTTISQVTIGYNLIESSVQRPFKPVIIVIGS